MIYWDKTLTEQYDIPLIGVIHIGAHIGQEYKDYVDAGIEDMLFFEPVKSTFEMLRNALPKSEKIKLFNTALGNTEGTIDMFITDVYQGQSSSILKPNTHLKSFPQIVFNKKETVNITKLDNVKFEKESYNIINVDVQGYELEVLKGAKATLSYIDFIFAEINVKEVYTNCAKVSELDAYLKQFGFVRMNTNIYDKLGYGDAVYVKLLKV